MAPLDGLPPGPVPGSCVTPCVMPGAVHRPSSSGMQSAAPGGVAVALEDVRVRVPSASAESSPAESRWPGWVASSFCRVPGAPALGDAGLTSHGLPAPAIWRQPHLCVRRLGTDQLNQIIHHGGIELRLILLPHLKVSQECVWRGPGHPQAHPRRCWGTRSGAGLRTPGPYHLPLLYMGSSHSSSSGSFLLFGFVFLFFRETCNDTWRYLGWESDGMHKDSCVPPGPGIGGRRGEAHCSLAQAAPPVSLSRTPRGGAAHLCPLLPSFPLPVAHVMPQLGRSKTDGACGHAAVPETCPPCAGKAGPTVGGRPRAHGAPGWPIRSPGG